AVSSSSPLRSGGSHDGCERDLRRDGEGASPESDPRSRDPAAGGNPLALVEIPMETIGNAWLWAGFSGLVLAALLVDLALMRHGGAHKVTFREAAWWSLGWVALAMAFNAALWWYVGQTAGPGEARRVGLEFLTGYLVEKAL